MHAIDKYYDLIVLLVFIVSFLTVRPAYTSLVLFHKFRKLIHSVQLGH
jgi:hypothetical protein